MYQIKKYLLAFLLLPLAFCYGNDCQITVADELNENCIESFWYVRGGESTFQIIPIGASLGIGKRYHNHSNSLGYGYSLNGNFPIPSSFSAKGELLFYFKYGIYIGFQAGVAFGDISRDRRHYSCCSGSYKRHWTAWPTFDFILFGKEFELCNRLKNFCQFSVQPCGNTFGATVEYGIGF